MITQWIHKAVFSPSFLFSPSFVFSVCRKCLFSDRSAFVFQFFFSQKGRILVNLSLLVTVLVFVFSNFVRVDPNCAVWKERKLSIWLLLFQSTHNWYYKVHWRTRDSIDFVTGPLQHLAVVVSFILNGQFGPFNPDLKRKWFRPTVCQDVSYLEHIKLLLAHVEVFQGL